ncbi:EAL domain-containing protein, partial [Psychromonas sp.]|nr:EAL domain-containing protein [Psychromonas sp.]
LSKHDSLTGLNNRIALFNHLETAIARSHHKQIPIGILFIEITGFKAINEHFGHSQGDLVMKSIAKRLKQSIFDKDIIARFGDEQFVLVIDELDNEQVIALIAQKIAKNIAEPINIEGVTVNLSLSIGISICPDDGIDLDTLLSNAESAMQRSKNDRSSLYHFYTNELTVNSTHQIELEDELKLALEKEQFELYYQPQFDLSSRKVVAIECLLRWNHPEQGVLLPEHFLMLAEQSGLLIDLSINMFRKCALQAAKWHAAEINFGRISFNLSKLELSQTSLLGEIQKILLDTGCKASWFEFAIEETLFSSDIYAIQDNLLNISRLGISLTVDGFGEDRSVLYSIGKLNIEKFKISKHFIQGVPGYLAGDAIIKSVHVLANSLGVDVVGEGMENSDQESLLCGQKIEAAKGAFQKGPMKASEATFYLRCHKRK